MSKKVNPNNEKIERSLAIYIMNKCGMSIGEIADIYSVSKNAIFRSVVTQRLRLEKTMPKTYHRFVND